MKYRVAPKRTAVAKTKPDGLAPLIAEVRSLIQSARRTAASTINTLQVLTNFEIGRRIVEHEQKGKRRAEYGAELLKALSARLTEEFGKGFSPVNLSHMRRFFLIWKERVQIFQQPTEKLALPEKSPPPLDPFGLARTQQTTPGKSPNIHARKYKLYLPSKQLLKRKLLEWIRQEEAKA